MKNSEYWKLRFGQIEAASNKNALATYDFIMRQYAMAEREIEKQIANWYQRFAKNNQISMAEARKWLTAKELAEFKWDVDEYIKYAQMNVIDPQWTKQLENVSARFHISRFEALKIETQQTIEKLFGGQTDEIDRLLKKNSLDTYYRTIYEVQKGVNIGWDIAAVDDRTLQTLVSKPWATDGKNFSDRIWSNKTNLINEVQTQLTRNFMLGKAPDEAIKAIAKKMDTSKAQAGRLVMTESAYFSSQSQKQAFNELDVERFEIVATLDSSTSEICQQMDGKVMDMKDFEAGVTAPPFHPWCRSTTIPYFEDNYGERIARGADGKTYYVDSNIKYPEWKKRFADGGVKAKENGLLSELTDKPNVVGTVDITKQDDIIKSLDEMEEASKGLDYEVNRTITADGKVWDLRGDGGSVHSEKIETDFGVSLNGSYSYHNHPEKVSKHSFSADDVEYFFKYGLSYSKASDKKYEYIIHSSKESLVVSGEEIGGEFRNYFESDVYRMAFDEEIEDIDDVGYHMTMEYLSQKYKFNYERNKK